MSGGAKTPWNWSSSSSGAPQTLAMKSKENEPVQKPSSRARLIKLASENNVRKDSKGAGKEAGDSSIDDTLEHLWASGHEEEVERHLLKGPAGTVIAHQKGQIAELRKALKESVEEAKRQEMRARELQRFLEEVEQQGEDNREAALQLEQMKLRAERAEEAIAVERANAAVEREKRMLLETALNKMIRAWETRHVDLMLENKKEEK